MIIDDFSNGGLDRVGPIDVCIVGTGPAGMTIAREMAGSHLRILALESGGLQEEPSSSALNEVENVGAARIVDQTLVRSRALGGTSAIWSGRCAPLDSSDYEARPWVRHSGWPITPTELKPYFERAATYLGVGSHDYEMNLWKRPGEADVNPDLLQVCHWQYSRDPHKRSDYARFARVAQSDSSSNLKILLHANVLQIIPSETDKGLHTIEVADLHGRKERIQTPVLVLAAGAIENARLLLASTQTSASGVGNSSGMVGRFLMDHPRCTVGTFDLADTQRILNRFGRYFLPPAQGGHILIHGFRLSPELQHNRHLLNASAWLGGEVADNDPITAARRLLNGTGRALDAWSILTQPTQVIRSLGDAFRRRREISRKYSRLTIECTVEQPPDFESSITLSEKRDAFGIPLPRINWRIGEPERKAVATLARHIADELARLGWPKLKLADWIVHNRYEDADFLDFAHSMGTTRMSATSHNGVVDENCQIHGLRGIYVAGGSVFPTAGHVNPTWTIVALAIRLADWLKSSALDKQPKAQTDETVVTQSSPAPAAVLPRSSLFGSEFQVP